MEDNELEFLLDTMTWSFSRLQSFYNCKYEWKLHYVECNRSENSFFGEYGSLMHKILEMYETGELSLFDLNEYYEGRFNEYVPHDAPPNKFVDIRQSYFDKGLDYLNNIDLDLEDYDVLGVERKVEFEIAGKHFVGFIDLLVRNKKTKEIIIVDHKSASIKILKSGKISKSDQQHFLDFQRQLYLYSIPVLKEYGPVSKLRWNMFKDKKWIEISWEQDGYDEAIQWAKNTIGLIENEKEWCPNQDYYYCNYLCGQRNHACEFKPQPVKKEQEDDRYYNPETESFE